MFGSERHKALTPDDKRSICQRAHQIPLSSTAKITREFRKARDAQVPTVYRTLKKAGFSHYDTYAAKVNFIIQCKVYFT